MKELQTIETHYGTQRAKRSNVLLINHIHEGMSILDAIGAPEITKRAFCLHPIVQNKVDIDVSWSDSYSLAVEYAEFANSFLCKPETDYVLTEHNITKQSTLIEICLFRNKVPSLAVAQMLYADKIQNRKDFRLYHVLTHSRAEELEMYFNTWIDYLTTNFNIFEGIQ